MFKFSIAVSSASFVMRVSLEGNIGSGKSTAMRGLPWVFGDVVVHPEPVERWKDLLERFYADPTSATMDLQLRVLLDLSSVEDDGRFHVVERSPDTSVEVFGEIVASKGWISDSQLEALRSIRSSVGWKADAIVFVDSPPALCFDRIQERKMSAEARAEPGDFEYLEEVSSRYEKMLSRAECPVFRVDGSKSKTEVLEEVVRVLRELRG